ncbi:c2h2 and c2hc zinc finger [Lasallia pustulata]|uniref:C2h2 and c2hc zinc finger n=1 Tax=Lasallia pustulata TaxID=136370 RepID=A0A1W5CX49_9LECA|nr:c2h2 and c2hc zinc finger [Lasallia pustulata]
MATITATRLTSSTPQTAPVFNTAQTHPFTCNTCQVAFRNSDLQRGHMRSDWHRYNLKRRVASLPPLSSEVFAEKVLTAQASSSAAAAKASFEKVCTACQKTYYSENAYQNHLGSQKHRLRAAAHKRGDLGPREDETGSVMSSTISLGEPIETASVGTNDPEAEAEFSEVVNGIKEASLEERKGEPVSRRPTRPHHSSNEDRPEHPLSQSVTEADTTSSSATPNPSEVALPNHCLFCNYESPTFKLDVMHMTKHHGLFIPEQTYLVDLEGLIGYLQRKITEFHECLYCHKVKGSTSSIQTHMKDKGHCMIAFDEEEDMIEVGQFYDFSSTYSDFGEDDHDTDMGDSNAKSHRGVKLGCKRSEALKTIASGSDGDPEMQDGEENGDGWETDSSVSSLDSEDLIAVPIDHTHAFERLPMHRHHSHTDPRPHRTVDGFHSHAHSHHAVFHSDYELHLPSGRTAGHRSLSRYYRQNLHNYPTAAEQMERRMIANTTADSDSEGQASVQGEGRGRQIATRANGGLGMIGVSDAKKREVRAVEKRERKREQRARQQYQWGVDKRGNSQKHFRDPLLQ